MESHEKMKIIRLHRNLTQKEVAEKMGTSVQNYSQYENGKRIPKLSTLEKIAAALDCSVSDLSKDDILSSGSSFESLGAGGRFAAWQALFFLLNDEGQQKALEMVDIIRQVPGYTAKEPPVFGLSKVGENKYQLSIGENSLDKETLKIFDNEN